MPAPEIQQPATLAAELEQVTRREAWLRARLAQQFVTMDAELKELRARVQQLSDELGARNTYVHELHLARDAAKVEEHRRWADLQYFAARLDVVERERDLARETLRQARGSLAWKVLAALGLAGGSVRPAPTPGGEDLPAYDFLYHLETQPFRVFRVEQFTLRGWVMPRDGRAISALRVRVGATQERIATRRFADPEVARVHGVQPTNPAPGFEIEFVTPPGRHRLRLEAQLEFGAWYTVLATPIWVEPTKAGA